MRTNPFLRKNQYYVTEAVEGTCRICIKTNYRVIGIFGEQGRALRLAEKMDKYLSIKIYAGDGLSLSLCQVCKYCVLMAAEIARTEAGRSDDSDSDEEYLEYRYEDSASSDEEEPLDLSMKPKVHWWE